MAMRKAKTPKIRVSKTVEEKNIGSETINFDGLSEIMFERSVRDTLNHYNYFYAHKDTTKWAADWVKKNRSKSDLKYFRLAPDWVCAKTAGSLCKMMLNGATFSKKRMDFVNKNIDAAIAAGKQVEINSTDENKKNVFKKTPADIVKERTSDFIAELEDMLDNSSTDWEAYSLYDEFIKENAPYNMAKAVVDYYTPLKAELEELINKKTADLVEAYSHMNVKECKLKLKVVSFIIEDTEKFMMRKKAVRKTRVKKPQTASAQISKMKYLKSSAEFKLTSIDPVNIIGASELYVFNTKYRDFIRLVTSSSAGFQVKGSTIQNVDLEASSKKKLRKPDEFFVEFMKSPKTKSRKIFDDLKTRGSSANGRINDHMIIVKVYG